MKKLLLGLGSIAAVAAPIAAVVSCGGEDTPAKQTQGKSTVTNTESQLARSLNSDDKATKELETTKDEYLKVLANPASTAQAKSAAKAAFIDAKEKLSKLIETFEAKMKELKKESSTKAHADNEIAAKLPGQAKIAFAKNREIFKEVVQKSKELKLTEDELKTLTTEADGLKKTLG